ncbi:MAG: fasciclin domain-containing protein [Winogradskyella sp.]|uniref:fasciclin domain-containing protein n=1 Tax=Winogradskyella sp. TaxID=1883156 RepID=UPI0018409ADD|nr:fasciclin domain-containing protein [Winogradskyella sp.]
MFNKITLIFFCTVLLTTCKDNSKEIDRTPVAEEELEDLNADATFNDVMSTFDMLEQDPDYNSLLKLANQAQMMDDFQNLSDVTFFAPTNTAIERLPEDDYNSLRLPSNLDDLRLTLKYHIVKGERDAARLISMIENNDGNPYRLETITGRFISLSLEDNTIVITDEQGTTAKVSSPDIETSNGVIHGVDRILRPTIREVIN